MTVFVECNNDWETARLLGVSKRELRHEGSKGNVVNRIRRANEEAVGLIDEDPGKGGRPSELKNYEINDEAHGLRVLVHRGDRRKRFIEVCPSLEDWLVARARACRVEMSDRGLPDSAHELHKNPEYGRTDGFRKFVQHLLEEDEGMRRLQKLLCGQEGGTA